MRGRLDSRVHGARTHRHARGARRLPERRDPALRAAAAAAAITIASTALAPVDVGRNGITAAAVPNAADVKREAAARGFDLCGVARAGDFPELRYLGEWL